MAEYEFKHFRQPANNYRGGLLFSKQLESGNASALRDKILYGADDNIRVLQIDSSKEEVQFDPLSNNTNRTPRKTSDKNTLKKDDQIRMGDVTVTVTDPYGIRSFEGREGKHSTGIDLTTNTGKAHAMNDMIIEDVKVQGDGRKMKPTEGASAGYYIIARNSDGTRSQYMHLNPMTKDEMQSLKGKKLKRGDEIWGYNIGSGSMSGPHVKYRVYIGNSGTESHIDPSSYLRGLVG
jgi:murein DD-endopeptidase MepM/ murein hydrolase activator NlpD